MTKYAIYARYSSDLQNPSSINDQILLCQKIVTETFGAASVPTNLIYSDAAVSGSIFRREGLLKLLHDIEYGLFDVLVSEGLDRISRSMKDTATIFEILKHNGIKIYTSHEHWVTELHVAVTSAMNSLYLTNLKEKMRRASIARLAEGRIPAGLVYGYDIVRGHYDSRGKEIKGLRSINETEANIVRQIFADFAKGVNLNQIIKSLNDQGIPSPSGGNWRITTLNASRVRGEGLLHNEMYIGKIVYNRSIKVTDPVTGKQRHKRKPVSEWVRQDSPHLRIIDDETWLKVQSHFAKRLIIKREAKPKKPRDYHNYDRLLRPLTRLVFCGVCGAEKHAANETRYVCSAYRVGRKCSNSRGLKESQIKEVLIGILLKKIDNVPNWLVVMATAFETYKSKENDRINQLESFKTMVKNYMDLYEKGINLEEVADKLLELQNKIRLLNSQSFQTVFLPSSNTVMTTILRKMVWQIANNFEVVKFYPILRSMLQIIIKSITLIPTPYHRGEDIEIILHDSSAWPEFYRRALEVWPELAKEKKGG